MFSFLTLGAVKWICLRNKYIPFIDIVGWSGEFKLGLDLEAMSSMEHSILLRKYSLLLLC